MCFVAVLSCLDSGEECINGGECIQRPLGDYVCSCPYPYCGLRCQNQRPSCDGILSKNQRLNVCFSDFLGTSPGVTQVATTIPTTTTNAACSSNLCNNRGICQHMRYGTGVQCYCTRGWSGSRCQYGKLKPSKFLSDRLFFLFSFTCK